MLSADVLEQLRLLTNLETNERKLLQIVLIGQPELRTMLERPELEQLAQRVIARFHLNALSAKETEHYIRHRLSVAGMTRADPVRPQGAAAHPRDHARRAAPDQPALRSRHARRLCARPAQHRRRDDREGRARGVRPLDRRGAGSQALRQHRRHRPRRRRGPGAGGRGRVRSLRRLAPMAAPTSLAAAGPASAPAAAASATRATPPTSTPPAASATPRGAGASASSPGRDEPERDHRRRHAGRDRCDGGRAERPRCADRRRGADAGQRSGPCHPTGPLDAVALRSRLQTFGVDEKTAWRELLPMWGIDG